MSRRERRYRPKQLLRASGRLSAPKRAVLCTDADGENGGVEQREDERHLPQPEDQRQDGDFSDDDEVIGVIDQAIRAAANQRCLGQDDDPGRPAGAKRGKHPDARQLDQHEQRRARSRRSDGRAPATKGCQPQRMDARRSADNAPAPTSCAPCASRRRVLRLRQPQLAEALQRHERKDDEVERSSGFEHQSGAGEAGAECGHQHPFGKAALEAAVRARTAPSARSCCRNRCSTSRSRLSSPWLRWSAVSIASITFTPPGWQQKRSMSSRAMPSLAHMSSTAPARSLLDERRDRAVEHDGEARDPRHPSP